MHADASAAKAVEPAGAEQPAASDGKLKLRKRKAAPGRGSTLKAAQAGGRGKAKEAVGLDVPYTWGN